MNKTYFEFVVGILGAGFAVSFCIVVLPPLIDSKDLIGAFSAGFVNPFSTGYSLDAIFCGLILVSWVLYERLALGIKYGWVALPISVIPGVATGFAVYLLIRSRQLSHSYSNN